MSHHTSPAHSVSDSILVATTPEPLPAATAPVIIPDDDSDRSQGGLPIIAEPARALPVIDLVTPLAAQMPTPAPIVILDGEEREGEGGDEFGNRLRGPCSPDITFVSHTFTRSKARQPLQPSHDTDRNISTPASDPDIACVATKRGVNALADYPHFRFQCAVHGFNKCPLHISLSNSMYGCDKCYCYVCDKPTRQCTDWEYHCFATETEFWKRKRHYYRYKARLPYKPVSADPMPPPAPHLL
eukprot:GFKZ01011762.1.p2 GENE.GFKZ01011762.1~~GFKZ01011762.1.p2  ORF type:complete len:267 (+),score=19.56 GFKZ01011762.1:76-801(+)